MIDLKPLSSVKKENENNNMLRDFMNLEQIQAGQNLWQNKFHEFDVYEHTQSFVIKLKQVLGDQPDKELLAAGVLHDIAKPVVAKPKIKDDVCLEKEPGKPYHTFRDHEKVGEQMVLDMDKKLFERYGLDQVRVAKLVGSHYMPMKGIKGMRRAKNKEEFLSAYNKLVDKLKETGLGPTKLMTLFLADKLAQGKFCTDRKELFAIRDAIISEQDPSLKLDKIYEMQKREYHNKE